MAHIKLPYTIDDETTLGFEQVMTYCVHLLESRLNGKAVEITFDDECLYVELDIEHYDAFYKTAREVEQKAGWYIIDHQQDDEIDDGESGGREETGGSWQYYRNPFSFDWDILECDEEPPKTEPPKPTPTQIEAERRRREELRIPTATKKAKFGSIICEACGNVAGGYIRTSAVIISDEVVRVKEYYKCEHCGHEGAAHLDVRA